ncbi:MAG: 3-phosphoshikimate 1-carboxyvinyltransferase [Myxococcales bacterium FL481]|nr:MAG: 3-phosphoshikimate 1-carboxyvinyltransferase [Myxococcales bacterium FL481]
MNAIAIDPLPHAIDTTLTLPGSKSYTNRAFIAAALARGETRLRHALFSDDTRYMADSLRRLGIAVHEDEASRTMTVPGCDGTLPASQAQLFVGNAGTAARFLPPMLALGTGTFELDGVPRMHQRPIGPLLTALRSLGANVECLGAPESVPLRVIADGLVGGLVRIRGDLSSQYISGLLLSAPYMRDGLKIALDGPLVSRPYVAMTQQTMRDFGVQATAEGDDTFIVAPGQRYVGRDYDVEPDASAASYFFAAAAITGGRARVEGLGSRSLQGDLDLVHILARMGCKVGQGETWTEVIGPPRGQLRGVEVDMRDLSDVAQTLAIVAPFASSPSRITGIGFIRAKETDRIGAPVRELVKLGARAEEEPDGIRIDPGVPHGGTVATYDDHRMAMSFAVLGLVVPGIRIENPSCTAKTFPDYFDYLARLR